jgi:hypothetical protein
MWPSACTYSIEELVLYNQPSPRASL